MPPHDRAGTAAAVRKSAVTSSIEPVGPIIRYRRGSIDPHGGLREVGVVLEIATPFTFVGDPHASTTQSPCSGHRRRHRHGTRCARRIRRCVCPLFAEAQRVGQEPVRSEEGESLRGQEPLRCEKSVRPQGQSVRGPESLRSEEAISRQRELDPGPAVAKIASVKPGIRATTEGCANGNCRDQ